MANRVALGLAALGLSMTAISAAEPPTQFYWADQFGGTAEGPAKIRRANLDGSDVVEIVPDLFEPWGVAVDKAGGKLYWTQPALRVIQRANLDGSDVEQVHVGSNAYFLALDLSGGQLYWTDRDGGAIRRSNLDGSGETLATSAPVRPAGIALDHENGKIYWTDDGTEAIHRVNLDGSKPELVFDIGAVVSLGGLPRGIALDVDGGKMYWVDLERGSGPQSSNIQRANLDGSGLEPLLVQFAPHDIKLDLPAGKMYFVDFDAILRADLDGSLVEVLVEFDATVGGPFGGLDLDATEDVDVPPVPATSPLGVAAIALLLLLLATRRLVLRREQTPR